MATECGEKIFLNISLVERLKDGPPVHIRNNCRIMVNEKSNLKFSAFFATKNSMIEPTLQQIHKWSQKGNMVKIIRLDNAGENTALQARADSSNWTMSTEFKYTAQNTPQQNYLAELGFSTLGCKGRALMHQANLPLAIDNKVFPYAFKLATVLDCFVVSTINNKLLVTRYKHYEIKIPQFATNLLTFGEAGTVKLKSLATGKLAGMACM